jgi:hypothetical protein
MAGIKRTSADKWFSDYIRARDNWTCQRCKRKFPPYEEGGNNTALGGLDTAHCFTRGHNMVRFDPDNAVALCYGCHSYADANKEEVLYPLVESIIGTERFEDIRIKSHLPYKGIKKDQKEIAKKYRDLFRGLI